MWNYHNFTFVIDVWLEIGEIPDFEGDFYLPRNCRLLLPVRAFASPLRGKFCEELFPCTFEVLREVTGWI